MRFGRVSRERVAWYSPEGDGGCLMMEINSCNVKYSD